MKLIFFACIFGFSQFANAAPLGTIPVLEKERTQVNVHGRTDLWTNPLKDKESPIRIYSVDLLVPFRFSEKCLMAELLKSESLSLGRSNLLVGEDQVKLGSDLRSQGIGIGFSCHKSDDHSYSIYTSYVSASDDPYHFARDRWVDYVFTYQNNLAEEIGWIFKLNSSKNRGFANNQVFPFLGIIYTKNFFEYLIGFPYFQMIWRPNDEWQATVRLLPVGFSLVTNHQLDDIGSVSAEASQTSRSYLHIERTDDDKRLFYEEKIVNLKLNVEASVRTQFIFSVGYAWDRNIYEAKTVAEPLHSRISLDHDIYGTMGLEFKP